MALCQTSCFLVVPSAYARMASTHPNRGLNGGNRRGKMTQRASFSSWCSALQDILADGHLPGDAAHRTMAPVPRRLNPPEDAVDMRQGAVLVLLYPGTNGVAFPITVRSERLLYHKGQISLPGGMQEESDSSLADTAARETLEEIGVPPEQLRFLGRLSPLYIPVRHSMVHPYVGCHSVEPVFRPNPDEVKEVVEMPLAALLDPAMSVEEYRLINGRRVRVPFYRVGPHKVWGATAMILGELAAILASTPALAQIPNHQAC